MDRGVGAWNLLVRTANRLFSPDLSSAGTAGGPGGDPGGAGLADGLFAAAAPPPKTNRAFRGKRDQQGL